MADKKLEQIKNNTIDHLEQLLNEKNYKGMMNEIFHIYELYVNDLVADKNTEESGSEMMVNGFKEFMKKHTETLPLPPEEENNNDKNKEKIPPEIKPENHEFVQEMIKLFNDAMVENAVDYGKQQDEWEKKIADGKIPGTELIIDEPKAISRVAHSITVEINTAASTVYEAYRAFVGNINGKAIGKKKTASILNEDKEERVYPAAEEKYGVTKEQLKKYSSGFIDRNQDKTTGFMVKSGQNPGEWYFSEIPEYLEIINKDSSEDALLEEERKAYEKIHKIELFMQRENSVVKLSRQLKKNLDDINAETVKAGGKLTDAAEYSAKYLENFTHLGIDYTMDKYHQPTDVINDQVVFHAANKLKECTSDYIDETQAVALGHRDNGTLDTPEGKHALNKYNNASDIYFLNEYALGVHKTFKDHNILVSDSDSIPKIFSYIDKFRKKNGYFVSGKPQEDKYTKLLDKFTEDISDSLANECLDAPCYDKLIINVKEQKRLYQKMKAAEKQGRLDVYEKFSEKLRQNAAAAKDIITECRTLESNGYEANNIRNILGEKIDRVSILDKVEKNYSLSIPKPERNYGSYMYMHTMGKAGKPVTKQEQLEDISKVLAAYSLEKLKRPYSVKNIHKTAKFIKNLYLLDENNSVLKSFGSFDEILKNKDKVLEVGEKVRRQFYSVKNGQYEQYLSDMKELKEIMRSSSGRSQEYKDLYEAVKKASELNVKTEGMTPAKKSAAFRQANIDVIYAVQKYVKGKEKERISDKGNDAFKHSMDALSIISKYTKKQGEVINEKVKSVISEINSIRKDPKLNDINNFEKSFGKDRIREDKAKAEINKAAPKKDNAAKNVKKQ
ncbi:hypothetical protein SAMN04487934_102110 [Eubacterium ruminantium]|nr:hypothetical protein SAMN04487934_102110 [Eubacterium ruminantium]